MQIFYFLIFFILCILCLIHFIMLPIHSSSLPFCLLFFALSLTLQLSQFPRVSEFMSTWHFSSFCLALYNSETRRTSLLVQHDIHIMSMLVLFLKSPIDYSACRFCIRLSLSKYFLKEKFLFSVPLKTDCRHCREQ